MTKEQNEYSNGILIPCRQDQFGEFILSLLGQPRTNKKTIEGTFELTKDNISDIFNLIDQRVKSQNNGHLTSFTAEVALSDGSIKKFSSNSDLMNYREIRPTSSVGILINLVYLINFPHKPHPEKQEITIKAITNINRAERELSTKFAEISYEIDYTDISWGEDIDHLLEKSLSGKIIKENTIRKFCRTNSSVIAIISGIFIFCLSLYLISTINNEIQSIKISEISKSMQNISSIGEKVNLLGKVISSGKANENSELMALLTMISAFMAGLAYFFSTYFLQKAPPSFILLTESANIEKTHYQKKYKHDPFRFLVSIAIATAINLGSSYIYEKISINSAKTMLEKLK